MRLGLGLDVYGTLVDPLAMAAPLAAIAGDSAPKLAELWRAKQLEYTFRRAVMGTYENFDVCIRQALTFAAESLRVTLTSDNQTCLLDQYGELPAYPDAAKGLAQLRQDGHVLAAFSNGVAVTLGKLLHNTALMPYLDRIISVDDCRTFKPAPRVYQYLARQLGVAPEATWLVSSNPFDVIGAKSAGLKAAWIKRRADAVFDPWDIQPDLVARDLEELADLLI